MTTRFAAPTERDLRFIRNTNYKKSDFGQEIRLCDSILDGAVMIVLLIGVLSLIAVAS